MPADHISPDAQAAINAVLDANPGLLQSLQPIDPNRREPHWRDLGPAASPRTPETPGDRMRHATDPAYDAGDAPTADTLPVRTTAADVAVMRRELNRMYAADMTKLRARAEKAERERDEALDVITQAWTALNRAHIQSPADGIAALIDRLSGQRDQARADRNELAQIRDNLTAALNARRERLAHQVVTLTAELEQARGRLQIALASRTKLDGDLTEMATALGRLVNRVDDLEAEQGQALDAAAGELRNLASDPGPLADWLHEAAGDDHSPPAVIRAVADGLDRGGKAAENAVERPATPPGSTSEGESDSEAHRAAEIGIESAACIQIVMPPAAASIYRAWMDSRDLHLYRIPGIAPDDLPTYAIGLGTRPAEQAEG